MFDVTDCYIIVFTDEAGTVHSVPFSKKDSGNWKANALLETVQKIGLRAEKYGRYQRPSAKQGTTPSKR
jgi:hypothetical protein